MDTRDERLPTASAPARDALDAVLDVVRSVHTREQARGALRAWLARHVATSEDLGLLDKILDRTVLPQPEALALLRFAGRLRAIRGDSGGVPVHMPEG